MYHIALARSIMFKGPANGKTKLSPAPALSFFGCSPASFYLAPHIVLSTLHRTETLAVSDCHCKPLLELLNRWVLGQEQVVETKTWDTKTTFVRGRGTIKQKNSPLHSTHHVCDVGSRSESGPLREITRVRVERPPTTIILSVKQMQVSFHFG